MVLFTVALIVSAILIISTVLLIFLCCAKRLAVLSDLQKAEFGENVEQIAELYKRGQMLVHEEKRAHGMLEKDVGTIQSDEMIEATYCGCCRRIMEVPNCRMPKLPLLKKTRVRLKDSDGLIHMSKLKDYYKSRIYMSQAPLKSEFPLFYEAIVQEKIGIVVWLSKPNDKIETYIPMKNGEKLTFGNYNVEYDLSGKRDEYDFYFIRVFPSDQTECTRVIVVVAHCWTLTAEPKHMTKHCDVISLIQCFHDFTTDNGFPGLLVHHVTGVNWTAGFVACYIGRQILLDQRKVNITGICRYIRLHRHCAFTFEKTSAKQLQVVYMVLGSFARTFAYESVGRLKPTEIETKLFLAAKKAHPGPRGEVSAWGGAFSYKGSLEKSGKGTSPAQSVETEAPPGGEKTKTVVENSKSMAKSTAKSIAKTTMSKQKPTDAYISMSAQEK